MLLHSREQVAQYVADGWWGPETWDSLLRARAAERPERTAVVDPPNRKALVGVEPQRLTWRELDHEVDRVSGALSAACVQRGDVVAVQLVNGVELAATLLAIARLRAVAMPIPVQLERFEVKKMCRTAGAGSLVTEARRGERSPAAEALVLVAEIDGLERLLAWGEAVPPGVLALHGVQAPGPPREEPPTDECVTICWTSGTESAPKAVPRCHGDWLALARLTVQAAELDESDVLLNPFPMVNMAGIGGMLLPWLLCGGTLVQHHPFDLPTYLGQLAREQVTYTVAAPAILNRLLLDERTAKHVSELRSLRRIGCGSAPLAGWMVKGYHERFGIEVLNYFASNEGTSLMSDGRTVPDPDDRAAYFPRDRPGPPGTLTRLVDLVTEEEIDQPGRAGELRIKGPAIFAGYLNAEELSDPFDAHGYLRTGDLFELAGAEQEFYRYVDRAKDIIVRGGMNISAAEVEGHLQSHPQVLEAAAVAVPDQVLGERVCAVVVPAPGGPPPTLEQLAEHLRELGVARYKTPERLELIDALPRNSVGKVLKRELIARLRVEGAS